MPPSKPRTLTPRQRDLLAAVIRDGGAASILPSAGAAYWRTSGATWRDLTGSALRALGLIERHPNKELRGLRIRPGLPSYGTRYVPTDAGRALAVTLGIGSAA